MNKMPKTSQHIYILVTGGTGFIGSHTAEQLLTAGYGVIIIDNLYNSHIEVIQALEKITGQVTSKKLKFFQGDIRDKELLKEIFKNYMIDAVMHFSGLKAVAESIEKPLDYFDINVGGSVALFQIMQEFGVKKIVFSSSATVYGHPISLPLTEQHQLNPINPYGLSKLMVEQILQNLIASDPLWQVAILRYFNPVGAHPSGLLGESPLGTPNNLMPVLLQTILGKREKLLIYGNDYSTPDGTAIRDYIHVMDLAYGHVLALKHLEQSSITGKALVVNMGTGNGYSVLEMVEQISKSAGLNSTLPYEITHRRLGDAAEIWADVQHAEKILGFKAKLSLKDMCDDAWRFAKNHKH